MIKFRHHYKIATLTTRGVEAFDLKGTFADDNMEIIFMIPEAIESITPCFQMMKVDGNDVDTKIDNFFKLNGSDGLNVTGQTMEAILAVVGVTNCLVRLKDV